MNFWQHIIVSFLLVLAVNAVLAISFTPTLIAATLLGAMLPDVDHEKTRIFRFVLAASAFTSAWIAFNAFQANFEIRLAVAVLVGLATAGALFLLKPRHRGLTHHPLFAVAVSLAVLLLTKNLSAALDVGVACGAHLLADRL